MLKRSHSLFILPLVFGLLSLTFSNTDIGYSNFFNVKVLRSGVLFQDRFRADVYNENDIGKSAINIDLESSTGLGQNKLFNASFYRFTQEIILSDSSIVLGLQGVPFGVCRLWNPTDKFNPVYALSTEPDKRKGVFGVNYRYYLDDLSYFQVVGNIQEDERTSKVAIRWRGFLFGDMGIIYVNASDISMYGIDQQINVFDTGIESRTEIAYIDDRVLNKSYWNICSGFEYAFPFMFTALVEYYYNGAEQISLSTGIWNKGKHYLGTTFSYGLNPLTTIANTSIFNLDDGSLAMNLYLSRSLLEELLLDIGVSAYFGKAGTEFSAYPKSLFFRLSSWL